MVPNHSVVLSEVRKAAGEKVLGKRKFDQISKEKLEHMSIRQEFPKPLASYAPLIEDEFLMRVPKKDKFDTKALRQKTKKMEKDAIRELKKDSVTLQSERLMEKRQRKAIAGRSQMKFGQVKDEI